MHRLAGLTAAFAIALTVTSAVPAAAQIVPPEPPPCLCPIIVPGGPVIVESYDVDVTVDRQVAVTRVTQVFRNDGHGLAEGLFLFPLPRDAAVSDLVLWIDNEPVTADLLSAEEARAIYEEIVRTLRDPALLEWAGHDLVQLSVFPIEPGDSRKVEVEYAEVLAADGGLVRFTHPFGSEHRTDRPIEQVTLRLDASSAVPVRTVYSPTHPVDVERTGDDRFAASFEAGDVLPGDGLSVYWSVSDDSIALDVLSFRDPGEDDEGFFVLFLTPGGLGDVEAVDKDVILVLDRSGSMEGDKFAQAQDAAVFVLKHLNEGDRFNVITFSSGIRRYASGLRPASEAEQGISWVEDQSAEGSTDINRALLEAFDLADGERPAYVIFLTDGLPTEGVTRTERILENAGNSAPDNVSLFAFGVGFDVDALLLDSLAEMLHGTTSYVVPGEDIAETVSGFYAKVSTPVLTAVEISFDGVPVRDVHPDPLPDLFAGEQLVVAGRYREPGAATVSLSGRVGGERRSFTYTDVGFAATGGDDFVPRLWATRKIGDLLKEMRLEGASDETVDQVVRLSTRYGIITPYTSFLVTEPGMLGDRELEEMSRSLRGDFDDTLGSVSGEAAVEYSAAASDLAAAQAPTATTIAPDALGVDAVVPMQNAGGHTFRFLDGIWVDTVYDPGAATVKVPFLSDAYFDLAGSRPAIADALALGDRVLVVHDGVAYEVVAEDAGGDEVVIPVTVDTPEVIPDPVGPGPVVSPQPGAGTQVNRTPWILGGAALLVIAIAGVGARRSRSSTLNR